MELENSDFSWDDPLRTHFVTWLNEWVHVGEAPASAATHCHCEPSSRSLTRNVPVREGYCNEFLSCSLLAIRRAQFPQIHFCVFVRNNPTDPFAVFAV
jgi:hypothetical protein